MLHAHNMLHNQKLKTEVIPNQIEQGRPIESDRNGKDSLGGTSDSVKGKKDSSWYI
ncbi:MAG: hypothetical protein R2850_00385 [Bacteroidia bacterium]